MKTVKIQMSKSRKLSLNRLGFKYNVQGIFFVVETDLSHTDLLKLL